MRITSLFVPKVQSLSFYNSKKNNVLFNSVDYSSQSKKSTLENFDKNIVLSFGKLLSERPKKDVCVSEIASTLDKFIKDDKKNSNPIIKSVKPDFVSRFAKRISENPNKNIIIGISGESASGKTTICETIQQTADKLNMPIEVISADNYFKDISALIRKYGSFDGVIESGYDVDSPNNFDMQQLHDDLEALSQGNDVKIPQYLVNGTGVSVPNSIPKKAQKVIVVEGLATLYNPVRNILDAEIFVDIDSSVQEKRYIKRAQISRNQTEDDAKNQLKYVREAAQKYLYPMKDSSDVVVDGSASIDEYQGFIQKLFGAYEK